MSSTNDFKALHKDQEHIAHSGIHAAVEGVAGSEEKRNHEIPKQTIPGVVEACEDCL